MSVSRYYNMCNKYVGRCVDIKTHDGHTHRGIIDRVTSDRVFLRPVGGNRNYGGYGYGWGGYGGWGWGWGFGAGIALGAIAGIAIVGAFW